jgi:SAM-dependent methyltransferase
MTDHDESTASKTGGRPRRRWLALAARVGRLLLSQPERTGDLVARSYDAAAGGYDGAWTDHMRHLSLAMLDRLDPPRGAACLDVACGTGFLTAELSRRTGRAATGLDASAGMLAAARAARGEECRFVWADAADYLAALPPRSVDVVTCGWALGYTRPIAVVRQIARVLRPGGRVGIIDNTLMSLREVLWAAARVFAERPAALRHVMRVRFLPRSSVLAAVMRACGLSVRWTGDGAKTYWCRDGRAAIDRLTATGAAAGFEFAADAEHTEAIFARFAEVMEERNGTDRGVPVTHRWLAAVGVRS